MKKIALFLLIVSTAIGIVGCISKQDKIDVVIEDRYKMEVIETANLSKQSAEKLISQVRDYMKTDATAVNTDLELTIPITKECEKFKTYVKNSYEYYYSINSELVDDVYGKLYNLDNFDDYLDRVVSTEVFYNMQNGSSEVIFRLDVIDSCQELILRIAGGVIYDVEIRE